MENIGRKIYRNTVTRNQLSSSSFFLQEFHQIIEFTFGTENSGCNQICFDADYYTIENTLKCVQQDKWITLSFYYISTIKICQISFIFFSPIRRIWYIDRKISLFSNTYIINDIVQTLLQTDDQFIGLNILFRSIVSSEICNF